MTLEDTQYRGLLAELWDFSAATLPPGKIAPAISKSSGAPEAAVFTVIEVKDGNHSV